MSDVQVSPSASKSSLHQSQPLDLPSARSHSHFAHPEETIQTVVTFQDESQIPPQDPRPFTCGGNGESPTSHRRKKKRSQLSLQAQRLVRYFPEVKDMDEYLKEFIV